MKAYDGFSSCVRCSGPIEGVPRRLESMNDDGSPEPHWCCAACFRQVAGVVFPEAPGSLEELSALWGDIPPSTIDELQPEGLQGAAERLVRRRELEEQKRRLEWAQNNPEAAQSVRDEFRAMMDADAGTSLGDMMDEAMREANGDA